MPGSCGALGEKLGGEGVGEVCVEMVKSLQMLIRYKLHWEKYKRDQGEAYRDPIRRKREADA